MSTESVDDVIMRQYKLVKRLGKGSYGVVWRGQNRETGETVAIKKCFDCFQNATDSQRIYREIRILQKLNKHENIIEIYDVVPALSGKDVYVISELMEADLGSVIRSGILEPVHVQFITYQLLCALKYLHSAHVVHRDIKPANILLNSDSRMKLCDFGLARTIHSERINFLTGYVFTRWYRGPEILMNADKYSFSVDVWAVGCIAAEMAQGKVLFPGNSTVNQLERIIEVTGWPDADIALPPNISRNIEVKPLCELLPKASLDALDLVRQLLQFDPDKRISAANAIDHPFLAGFRTGDEPVCNKIMRLGVDDNVKLKPDEYQTFLYQELDRKRQEVDAKYHQALVHISS